MRMKSNAAISCSLRTFFAFTILLAFLLPLTAQRITYKKEKKLQNRLQCANLALLQNEREMALNIYKEVRDNGDFSEAAFIANDSLAWNSWRNKNLEALYGCIKYSEKFLEISPSNELFSAKNEKYWRFYNDIRDNLVMQEDLCGIWVSDYTYDKHKAPYLILEIEKVGDSYIAHLHPTCVVTWKYPTYQYWGKYNYLEMTQLPRTECGVIWNENSVNAHFADKTYKKAHPQAASLAADAGKKFIDMGQEFYNNATSDPDFYKQPTDFRLEVYGASMGAMIVGGVLGIVSAILQTSKSYGYSVTFQGHYSVRGEMECTLTEDVLGFSSATGRADTKYNKITLRMLKVYPDYDLRFIGYNNWLVGSHSFTNKEAKAYPESRYKGDKILRHNEESYNRLFEAFMKSHENSPDSVKAYLSKHYNEFKIANEGTTFGVVYTDYGQYCGELKNGKPLDTEAKHYFKQENSLFIGVVKNNKRDGEGINYQYGDSTDVVRSIKGTWVDGKLSGNVEQDDYVRHMHFEGYYSNGYRHGRGVLTDTANNIVYEGDWDDHFGMNCLNGTVVEKNLYGDLLFSGEYEDNHREGHGTEYYWDGSTFQGSWKNGLKHGDGTLHIPEINENYYQIWKKGVLKCGMDIERNQKGEIVFNGEYKNDERNGFGTEYHEDGSVFKGYWKKGIKNGKGVLYDSDKSYDQTWKHGIIKRGMVIERNQDGGVIYEGEYRNDRRGGNGTEYLSNGDVYKGKWKNGYKHGKGVLRDCELNETYHQTWSYGMLKHGMAVERDQNGKVIYEGEYRNNKRAGNGTEYYENGCYYIGSWKDGVKHGKGKLFIPDVKESYEEVWDNGMIIKSE